MDLKEKIEEIVQRYPDRKSAVMPSLYLAQEKYGYLSKETMEEVAKILEMPKVDVLSVATFYTMFYTEPVGKNIVRLCKNISCMLNGADNLLQVIEDELNLKVKDGEVTTKDGNFTVETVECLGACDKAPVMMVNDETYFNLTAEKIREILTKIKGKSERPCPQAGLASKEN